MIASSVVPATRLGICTTEPIRLAGLCSVFEGHSIIQAEFGDLRILLADPSMQYVVLDLCGSVGWLEIVAMVRRARPDIRQIVLGPVVSDELIVRAIHAGTRAYLNANAGPLAVRQAVEAVLQGTIWAPRRLLSLLIDRLLQDVQPSVPMTPPTLSPREQQVLSLIMIARSNREIAQELGIEERTVKAYVASLLRKTGMDNRVSLSVQATQISLRESRRLSF
ncbi:response regulator transcription factor [Acidicapsa ligni]|uniref:response regulator transcription factor n=1 Tax=Acidicapsa ligni TaxID=542300 RepID=UPI0021E09449|nr:response regulator transcription factor [Acidicapsa ligni]